MGTGGMDFIHNAYNIYQKPEVNIAINSVKLAYNVYQICKLATHKMCSCCGDLFLGDSEDELCPNCINKYYNNY